MINDDQDYLGYHSLPCAQDQHPVMTTAEAANFLKMRTRKLQHLAHKGKIPAKKVGTEWRFLRSVLNRWVAGLQDRHTTAANNRRL